MKIDNYSDISKFVEDNLNDIDSKKISFSKKSQKETFIKLGKDIPDHIYSLTEITKEIDKVFEKIWKDQETGIIELLRRNKLDIELTIKEILKWGVVIPENRLNKKLLEVIKTEEMIVFDFESFKKGQQEKTIDNIEKFVENNIVLFNLASTLFSNDKILNALNKHPNINKDKEKIHNKTDMDEYLNNRYTKLSKSDKDKIIDEYKQSNFDISKTAEQISKQYILKTGDVEAYLKKYTFESLGESILQEDTLSELTESVASLFLEYNKDETQSIVGDLKKIIKRYVPLILSNGFPVNLTNVNSGVMIANAGDSAQFLFIARAILAGFDSSNVDVRSSRYDCIVNYKNKIFRVQVKGISDNYVRYKDRSRGGRGIDHTNERNVGRRITSEDCDIYAAVDKLTGTVFLIPIEHLENTEKDSENISELKQYRENWEIFEELFHK